jgi:two-component sensor histidine kinase
VTSKNTRPVSAGALPANLELRFQPTVEQISSTRRFVCSFFEPLISDPDVVSRIGLATHELLENILKYATDGRTTTKVDLAGEGATQTLSIETTSAITPERRAGLEEIFSEMASASDALSYYQLTMARARHRRHGSGLGLARIWAEAEMNLSIHFDGDRVTIRAIANLSTEHAS